MKLWIARNNKGKLRLFRWMPEYINNLDMWYEEHLEDGYGNISNLEFPEVTFENSPQEIELKLANEIVGVAESPSKTFPRVNEFEVGASYRR